MYANFHIERPQPPEFINITYLGANNSTHYLINGLYQVILKNFTSITMKELLEMELQV